MNWFTNKKALVTGAGSGIGKALATALASRGCDLFLAGRDLEKLRAAGTVMEEMGAKATCHQIDISRDSQIKELGKHLSKSIDHLDILIHSAGLFHMGRLGSAPVKLFDLQYKTNVRGPYLLTQILLPLLKKSQMGQVVFINSTAGLRAPAGVSQYAATKHALTALAESFRQEANKEGIRVLSVFPGRTASPMQKRIFDLEGRVYRPELLLQPGDVAETVLNALSLPSTAEVTDISIRPFSKTY